MSFLRMVGVIPDTELDTFHEAADPIIGGGDNTATVPVNASGKPADPATHWLFSVQLTSPQAGNLEAELDEIDGAEFVYPPGESLDLLLATMALRRLSTTQYALTEVVGIGGATETSLNSAGVNTPADLIAADAATLATATGMSEATIKTHQASAYARLNET